MFTKITNNLIFNNSKSILDYCKNNLVLPNPQYYQNEKMGFSNYNTDPTIKLYKSENDKISIPFGCLGELWKSGHIKKYDIDLADTPIDIKGELPLYDYQETAVNEMVKAKNGVLVSAAGSGKTQIGIELINRIGKKTLWLTHTLDLVKQSKDRFETYLQAEVGMISSGKANIKDVTFATVQTLSKMDLDKLKYEFSVVIVDECHRVTGSPAKLGMFYKVLNSLACRYKYGLTATAHRGDGLIKSMFSIIGPVIHEVPKTATNNKTLKAKVEIINTGISNYNLGDIKTDNGDISFVKLITELSKNNKRNEMIAADIIENSNKSCIVLSDRISQLEDIMKLVGKGKLITGKMTSKKGKKDREQAIKDMQDGKEKILFASYNLAKEGLDIPCLERLFLASPKKDYAVIVQSIGRIERKIENKSQGIVYDYVDNVGICYAMSKSRIKHYISNKNNYRQV